MCSRSSPGLQMDCFIVHLHIFLSSQPQIQNDILIIIHPVHSYTPMCANFRRLLDGGEALFKDISISVISKLRRNHTPGNFSDCLQIILPFQTALIYTERYFCPVSVWAITVSLLSFCYAHGSQYMKWHQTICPPSYFTPSGEEADENKPCKYN